MAYEPEPFMTTEFGRRPYVLKEEYPAVDPDTTDLDVVAEPNFECGLLGHQLSRLAWGDKKECPRWPTEKTRGECPRIQHGTLCRNLPQLRQQLNIRVVDPATRAAGAPAFLRITMNGVGVPPSFAHIETNGNFISANVVSSSGANDFNIRCLLTRALFGEYTRKTMFFLTAHVIMFQRILLYLSWFPAAFHGIEKCLTLETALARVESQLGLAEGFFGDNFMDQLEQVFDELCRRIIADYNRTIAQLPMASGADIEWYEEQNPELTFNLYANIPEYLLFTTSITEDISRRAWADTTDKKGYKSITARDMAFLNRQGLKKSTGSTGMSFTKHNILAACVRLNWSRWDIVRYRPAALLKLEGLYWYACDEEHRLNVEESSLQDGTPGQQDEENDSTMEDGNDEEDAEEEFEGFDD